MSIKALLPKFLTIVEVDPPATRTQTAEKAAVRRRGRKPDGETETIHQYVWRVHAVVTDVLTRAYDQPEDTPADERIQIADEIVSRLERPFVITTGTRAGYAVSGLEHESESVRIAIDRAVKAGRSLSLEYFAVPEPRPVSYLLRPRGRRSLANAITLAILTAAGKGMAPESLHRILKRIHPASSET